MPRKLRFPPRLVVLADVPVEFQRTISLLVGTLLVLQLFFWLRLVALFFLVTVAAGRRDIRAQENATARNRARAVEPPAERGFERTISATHIAASMPPLRIPPNA